MDGTGAVSGRRQLVRETRIRVRARRGVVLALILLLHGGRDEVYGRELHLFSAASSWTSSATSATTRGTGWSMTGKSSGTPESAGCAGSECTVATTQLTRRALQ
jgi:hypothetical protein